MKGGNGTNIEGGNLRSAAQSGDLKANIQQHAQTHSAATMPSTETMAKMMASLTGGKKRRNTRRSRKGAYKKRGGMGLGSVVREAVVPFGLYALQIRTQRKHRGSKKYMRKSRKSRKSRRSRR